MRSLHSAKPTGIARQPKGRLFARDPKTAWKRPPFLRGYTLHMQCMNRADIPSSLLNIPLTLSSGQAFRWKRTEEGAWLGVIEGTAVALLPDADGFWWRTHPEPNRWDILHRFFQLDVPLAELREAWVSAEPRMEPALERFAGLRILRQDPLETLFTFLCACCNTMTKISRSVNALAERYGEPLEEMDGVSLHRFPGVDRLAEAREEDLRQDLWGFRAPRVIRLARRIADHRGDWVGELAWLPYAEAKSMLRGEFGIGEKIADCICLFALGFHEAVPVDTHIRRVVTERYLPELAARSLTPKIYGRIAEEFRRRFGSHAGWAQQYFFAEEAVRRRQGAAFLGNHYF